VDAGRNLPAQPLSELAGADSADGGGVVAAQIMDVGAGLGRAPPCLGQSYILVWLFIRRRLDHLHLHQPPKPGRPEPETTVPKAPTNTAERGLFSPVRPELSNCYCDCERALLVVDSHSRRLRP